MIRWTLTMAVVLGAAGLIAAIPYEQHKHESARSLSTRDIAEKMDGKPTKATAVEVTYEPGQAGAPHRHPGPTFGYVVEGEYEWAIDDQPAKILKAGDTFYEPSGCLHRVTANPGRVRTRVVAWILHPRDAKQMVIPVSNK
jgi:quercetin dioxygenase-like cupin family protein